MQKRGEMEMTIAVGKQGLTGFSALNGRQPTYLDNTIQRSTHAVAHMEATFLKFSLCSTFLPVFSCSALSLASWTFMYSLLRASAGRAGHVAVNVKEARALGEERRKRLMCDCDRVCVCGWDRVCDGADCLRASVGELLVSDASTH